MDKTKFTPELISELKGFYVERVVDNMDTKDLVNYVMDDLDRYYEKMSDADFLEDAYNYWEDSFDDVVEEIKERTGFTNVKTFPHGSPGKLFSLQ